MSKAILPAAALALLLIAACKKDRTCECTSITTTTYPGAPGYPDTVIVSEPSVTTTHYKKINNSDMKTLCGSGGSTSTQMVTSPYTFESGTAATNTTCKIK